MDSNYKLVCLDSSVFIGKLKNEICNGIKRGVIFDQIWNNAVSGKLGVCISALTITEVFKPKFTRSVPAVESSTPHCEEFLQLIEADFLHVVEIDRETALLAHALCRKYKGIMPNDGLQLACAIQAGCDALLAWDRPLIGINHPDINIEHPSMFNPGLFENGTELASQEEIGEYEKPTSRAVEKSGLMRTDSIVVTSRDNLLGDDGKKTQKIGSSKENGDVGGESKRPEI